MNAAHARDVDLLNAFLDEIASSESALWKLSKWSDENARPFFNCKAVSCFQEKGYNVYRVRPLKGSLRKYRILYAYDAPRDEFHLLAVGIKPPDPMPSPPEPWSFYNYEIDHPTSKCILREYDDRGFTKLP